MTVSLEQAVGVHVGQHGRMVLPASMRRELKIAHGDALVAWMDGDRLILRSRAAVLQEIKAELCDIPYRLAAELIAERRVEAAQEQAE